MLLSIWAIKAAPRDNYLAPKNALSSKQVERNFYCVLPDHVHCCFYGYWALIKLDWAYIWIQLWLICSDILQLHRSKQRICWCLFRLLNYARVLQVSCLKCLHDRYSLGWLLWRSSRQCSANYLWWDQRSIQKHWFERTDAQTFYKLGRGQCLRCKRRLRLKCAMFYVWLGKVLHWSIG